MTASGHKRKDDVAGHLLLNPIQVIYSVRLPAYCVTERWKSIEKVNNDQAAKRFIINRCRSGFFHYHQLRENTDRTGQGTEAAIQWAIRGRTAES